MGSPVHTKKQQIDYLKKRMSLIQEMLEQMDVNDSSLSDLQRLENMLKQINIKINQFKHDWD
ncbi:hypothetical protein SAMN05192534_105124 [Alteribacillus persepolensis]|uniref:Uncharacterized protein n=1 Tax=Alteribacillus persepolensis TaxID=568899 RepID=A0A1G8CAZ7_9BACI|nr:SE1561 family protein [Alteribacillus persepolensis]SDH42676.1 hypothetical protein SAMN05192534_105124 [Alteribacillus persepolensis]